MLAIGMIVLLIALPAKSMEKLPQKPVQQTKSTGKQITAYSDQDRESIICMIATLKQGHLLFPIADTVF